MSKLQHQIERSDRAYTSALHRALSEHLVKQHLTDVHGIGPTLRDRILRYVFRGSLRDLDYAYRVSGIGPNLQRAISTWVRRYLDEFPRLLSADFPGKADISHDHERRVAALKEECEREQAKVERLDALYQKAHTAAQKLGAIRLWHFRRALQGRGEGNAVPSWYLQGVYPAWEPMPEWFETLLNEYGG